MGLGSNESDESDESDESGERRVHFGRASCDLIRTENVQNPDLFQPH